MSDTITFPLVHCLIKRGQTTVNCRVPEHEVRVLRAIHGDANVMVQPPEEYPEELTLSDSADFEFGRLKTKYYRKGDEELMFRAFRSGPDDLERFGFQLGRQSFEAAPASAQVDFAKEARKAKAEASRQKPKAA